MKIDLKILNDLTHGHNSGLRVRKANERVEKGFYYLNLAHQENFADKLRIRKAAALLLEAVDYQLNDTRPYMGLAYIFALLDQHEAGLEFLDAALEIEPDNIAIQAFQEHFQSELKQSGHPQPTTQEESIDFDTLYDQIEEILRHEIKEAGHLNIPAPTLDPQLMDTLKENMHRLLATHLQIQQKLQILDQEFDIGPLNNLSNSLLIFFARLKQIYQKSKQLLNLKSHISQTREEIKKLYATMQAEGYLHPKHDQSLEQLLDCCDAIADKLDEFESSSITITDLLPLYETLVKEIQVIQEAMDELPQQIPQTETSESIFSSNQQGA